MKRLLTTHLLLACIFATANAQTQYIFTRYGQADGLNSAFIQYITEDNKGFIWIGSEAGLTRFDGYTFKNYVHDPLDSNSLPGNSLIQCLVTNKGTLLIETKKELCRYDPLLDNFHTIITFGDSLRPFNNLKGLNDDLWIFGHFSALRLNTLTYQTTTYRYPNNMYVLPFGSVDINVGKDGNIWFQSSTRISYLNVDQKKFFYPTTHYLDGSRKDSLGGRKSLLITNAGVYTYCDRGLFKYNPSGETFDQISTYKGIISDDHEFIYPFYNTDEYVLQMNNGIIQKTFFADGRIEDIVPQPLKGKPVVRHFISTLVENENSLWLASDGNGIFHYQPLDNKIEQFQFDSNNMNSLSSNSIPHMFMDNSGVMWIICRGQGIVKMESIHQAFKPFVPETDLNNATPSDFANVRALAEIDSDHLLLGTLKRAYSFSKKDSSFSTFYPWPGAPAVGESEPIGAVYHDHEGRIWIGTWRGPYSILVCDIKNKRMAKFNLGEEHSTELDCNLVHAMVEDHSGNMWVGTTCGLFEIKPEEINYDQPQLTPVKFYTHSESDTSSLSSYIIFTMVVDRKNQLWVGTDNGLNRMTNNPGHFRKYLNLKNNSASIRSNDIRSLLEDHSGNIWAGTNGGGANRFNESTGTFTAVTTKDGLPNDIIYSMLEDKNGFLWFSTNKGLCRFDPTTSSSRNFSVIDGLQNLEYNTNSGIKTANGNLVFGGIRGINYFNPEAFDKKAEPQAVVITDLKVFDHDMPIDTSQIQFDFNQNYLSFEFAPLSHYRTQDNQFSYKLEGFDKDWVFSGTRHYATYTNLSPGKYIFRVRMANSNSSGESEATLSFRIHPPWYKTTLAIVLFILAGLGLITLIYILQRARLIRKERELSRIREAELKTEALEEKNRRAQVELEKAHELEKAYNQLKATQDQLIQQEKLASLGQMTAGIAHEIQNPLNFVNNFSEVSGELIDEAQEAKTVDEMKEILADLKTNLEKVNHHGKRASSIVRSMLDHSRTSTGEKTPTDINRICDEFITLAYHGMRARHSGFQCDIVKELDPTLPKVNVVSQDVSRVLLNIFNNAMHAVKDKPHAQVTVTTINKGDHIEIKIRDNGKGMPEQVKQKIFEPFFTTKAAGEGTGLGLSISYEIIKAHGGEIRVDSKENEYTEFTVVLRV